MLLHRDIFWHYVTDVNVQSDETVLVSGCCGVQWSVAPTKGEKLEQVVSRVRSVCGDVSCLFSDSGESTSWSKYLRTYITLLELEVLWLPFHCDLHIRADVYASILNLVGHFCSVVMLQRRCAMKADFINMCFCWLWDIKKSFIFLSWVWIYPGCSGVNLCRQCVCETQTMCICESFPDRVGPNV